MRSDAVTVKGVALESTNWAVTVKTPADVGVPAITPVVALKVNPGGSVPAVKLSVIGLVPGVVTRVVL
jgi:hypothetical protein